MKERTIILESTLTSEWNRLGGNRLALEGVARIFHDPKSAAIDLFFPEDGSPGHSWVTDWGLHDVERETIAHFLRARGVATAVTLSRPERGLPPPRPVPLFGAAPEQPFRVHERCSGLSVWIRLSGETRHPGLFLDHGPLRAFLLRAVQPGARVANLFCYTGALGLAAARAGASHVAQVDLSKPILEWARENGELLKSPGSGEHVEFHYHAEDAFGFLARQAKANSRFDWVLIDPPSFSRTKDGQPFSVRKDTGRLIASALRVLPREGGHLVFSTNSAEMSWHELDAAIDDVLHESGVDVRVLRALSQEEQFPAQWDHRDTERYLKGYVLQTTGNRPATPKRTPFAHRSSGAGTPNARSAREGAKTPPLRGAPARRRRT